MTFISILGEFPRRVRALVAPRYRTEKHYMRGFGPACAARQAGKR